MKRLILSSIILWLAAGGLYAESKMFQLRNGSVIAGPVLKETPSVYFVDLGYDVLTLPRDQVATYTVATALPPLEALTAREVGRSTEGVTSVMPAISPPFATRKKFGSINEMIEACAPSVGIVSTPHGLGAGFLITPDGRMLTNFHVVENERFCEVTLFIKQEGRTSRVKFDNVEVVASSPLLDIALLTIPLEELEAVKLPALSISPRPAIDVGSPVYAIGNPGMGASVLEHSVSEGIVSSRQRNINDIVYVQTTAAVNPGNSGGPLLDSAGRVVGLVTYKAAFQENIAFALPPYYISHFLANEEAYSVSKMHPNTGFRYLPPQ